MRVLGLHPDQNRAAPPEACAEVRRAAGVSGAERHWTETRDYRNYMIRNLDDKEQIDGYAGRGAVVVKVCRTTTSSKQVGPPWSSASAKTAKRPSPVDRGDRPYVGEHDDVADSAYF